MRLSTHLLAIATLTGVVSFTTPASRNSNEKAAAIFVTKVPSGYRDWRLISVAP